MILAAFALVLFRPAISLAQGAASAMAPAQQASGALTGDQHNDFAQLSDLRGTLSYMIQPKARKCLFAIGDICPVSSATFFRAARSGRVAKVAIRRVHDT
jgi:hypothetical protein